MPRYALSLSPFFHACRPWLPHHHAALILLLSLPLFPLPPLRSELLVRAVEPAVPQPGQQPGDGQACNERRGEDEEGKEERRQHSGAGEEERGHAGAHKDGAGQRQGARQRGRAEEGGEPPVGDVVPAGGVGAHALHCLVVAAVARAAGGVRRQGEQGVGSTHLQQGGEERVGARGGRDTSN